MPTPIYSSAHLLPAGAGVDRAGGVQEVQERQPDGGLLARHVRGPCARHHDQRLHRLHLRLRRLPDLLGQVGVEATAVARGRAAQNHRRPLHARRNPLPGPVRPQDDRQADALALSGKTCLNHCLVVIIILYHLYTIVHVHLYVILKGIYRGNKCT